MGREYRDEYYCGNKGFINVSKNINIEDNIVKYCRRAFKNKYKNMWIEPVYFDDKYWHFTIEFFSEVGVRLYPKLTDLKKAMQKARIKIPKTKEEWENYKSFVYDIVHSDIEKNKENVVKPINIVITGVRYSINGKNSYKNYFNDNNFREKFTSIKIVQNLNEK